MDDEQRRAAKARLVAGMLQGKRQVSVCGEGRVRLLGYPDPRGRSLCEEKDHAVPVLRCPHNHGDGPPDHTGVPHVPLPRLPTDVYGLRCSSPLGFPYIVAPHWPQRRLPQPQAGTGERRRRPLQAGRSAPDVR